MEVSKGILGNFDKKMYGGLRGIASFTLEQSEIPTHWYNVVADLPNPPLPPLGPDGSRCRRSRWG
jgi:hypothetical protein